MKKTFSVRVLIKDKNQRDNHIHNTHVQNKVTNKGVPVKSRITRPHKKSR